MAFLREESGAVTVDWVVLAGVLVVMAGSVVTVVSDGMQNAGSALETSVENKIQSPG